MSSGEMAPGAPDPPPAPENNAEDQMDPEEYEMLDAQLDDLNTALDVIEQKNDQIRAEFFKLLQSNKEIREELKKEIESVPPT